MTDFALTRRALLAGSAAAALAPTQFAFGASPDVLKIIMEFRIYGANSPMFLSQKSIFPKHNLDVTPIGSAGSGESVRNVAAGVYKFGLADAGTVVAFAGNNPKVTPKIVLPIFDKVPACVISLKRKPVTTLEELKHVKIGTGSSDAGAKLFPALMRLNNIDIKSLDITTTDVKLRDAMLLTGKVDCVIGFDYTSVFNLIGNGVKLEDISLLYFSDMGFHMFGNALIAHPEVIEKEPDLVKRVADAIAQTWVYANTHRQESIDAVMQREKLLDPKVELARLSWVLDRLILTPNVKKNGLGTFEMSRLSKGIDLVKEGFDLKKAPSVDEIYDGRFMPALKDRMFA
jgi:NitT/TauT family transport system substrate-binding protein